MKAEYVSHYLSDNDVANFARHSFDRLAEEFTQEQNHNLIRFLARGMSSGDWDALLRSMVQNLYGADVHELAVYLRSIPEHWVPFAHPHITLRMEAPVPIRTQCFKHKQGLVESEVSRRYISSTPELYVPDEFRMAANDKKQGSGGVHPENEVLRGWYVRECQLMTEMYEEFIRKGVCPEQARFMLPQGCEVKWVWTGSLYAFANFYNQRTDSHAQKEIQDLAEQVGGIIAPLYPVSWAALTQGYY